MKFLADVNIAQSVINLLRDLGHDVLDSKKEHLLSPDVSIIQIARDENRIILTRDKDYLDLTQLPKYKVAVIFFKLFDQKPDNIISHLQQLLINQDEEVLITSVTTIAETTANSVRIL